MKRNPQDAALSHRIVSRRGLVLGGLQAAFVGALGTRMITLQVEEAEEFQLLAEENRINLRLLPPARGQIFDRNGTLIAGNTSNYSIVIRKEDAGDVEETLARLQTLVAIAPDDLERARRELDRRSHFVPVTITDRLTWEELSRVAVNAPALPGITPEVGLSRHYPKGQDFAHVIGYVGPVSDYDLSKMENPDPLLQIPRFQIGKTGVESKLEAELRGSAGAQRIEVNAAGRVMREVGRKPPDSGGDLQLTVDAALQRFAIHRMGDESASAVVIDVRNGDVLCAASAPSFDPNLFVRGISGADYKVLTEDDHRPLATKTVQGAYPPGSTFKMLVALAGLEAGVIGPGNTAYCPGYLQLGNRRFHCWKRGGHGQVALRESLEQSCDVYYYELAQKVGIDAIAAMARRFGMGQEFDLPLSAVRSGIMPDKDWKRQSYDQPWHVGDSLNASIGQGYVLSTPMQLAVMSARIASGREVVPRLVRAREGVPLPEPEFASLGVSDRSLALIRDGMDAVVNGKRGTAGRSKVTGDYSMAGKTGTSQVRNITAEERARGVTSNDQLPWNRRDHALFVAYAPVESPRYAISVVVEHGGGGSAAAAPIARDILLWALYNGRPPIEAYPSDQHGRIATMFDEIVAQMADGSGPDAA